MLDLTTVELSECTEKDFYSFLLAFNESIVFKRGITYTYDIVIEGTPTTIDPEPVSDTVSVYFAIPDKSLACSVYDMEEIRVSRSHDDYGITGDRIESLLRGKALFLPEDLTAIGISTLEEIYNIDRYNYLTSVSLGDLSFLKDMFHKVGVKNNWPVVTSEIAENIVLIVTSSTAEHDELLSDSSYTAVAMDAFLNRLRVNLERLFNPHLDPETILE